MLLHYANEKKVVWYSGCGVYWIIEYGDITTTADERCDALLENASVVAEKFTLFSSCHSVYSSRHYLSDDDLENLGKIHVYTATSGSFVFTCVCVLIENRTDDFLTFFRHQFVGTSITPKTPHD